MDCSLSNLRRSVVESSKFLGSKIDLFVPGRLDGKTSIEDTMSNLKVLQDEGLFGYIGLCEVNADTLKRAEKVPTLRYLSICFPMLQASMIA